MEIANCWLQVAEQSNVLKRGITPAEAIYLRKEFGKRIDGQSRPTSPFTSIEILETESETPDQAEYERLCGKYGSARIADAFPGEMVTFPKTFADAGFTDLGEPPKQGKLYDYAPLTKIKRGDDGKDMD